MNRLVNFDVTAVEATKVILMGMPGSGKTTVGRLLAARLGMEFVDLDAEIEVREGRTISEIFSTHGEQKFREIESAVLREVAARETSLVLATGGGTPCFFDNLLRLQHLGPTVYLTAPVALLVERTKAHQHRPLLPANHAQKITALLAEREAYYQQANVLVAVAGKAPGQIVDEIIGQLNR